MGWRRVSRDSSRTCHIRKAENMLKRRGLFEKDLRHFYQRWQHNFRGLLNTGLVFNSTMRYFNRLSLEEKPLSGGQIIYPGLLSSDLPVPLLSEHQIPWYFGLWGVASFSCRTPSIHSTLDLRVTEIWLTLFSSQF